MLSDLLKWGGKRLEPTQAGASGGVSAAHGDEPVIGSKAFPKFLAALTAQPSPVLLDFGPVIGTNVAFFGERLGCKLFIEDLVSDLDRHTRAGTLDALPGVARQALSPRRRERGRHPVLGHLRLPRQGRRRRRWPARSSACCAPAARSWDSSAPRPRPITCSFTKYEIVDDGNFRHRLHPGVGGVEARRCRTATSSGCSRGSSSRIRSCSRATSARCSSGGALRQARRVPSAGRSALCSLDLPGPS